MDECLTDNTATLSVSSWLDRPFEAQETLLRAVFKPENITQSDGGEIKLKDNVLSFRDLGSPSDGRRNGISLYRLALPHGRQIWVQIQRLATSSDGERKKKRREIYGIVCNYEELNNFTFSAGEITISFEVLADGSHTNRTHAQMCPRQHIVAEKDSQGKYCALIVEGERVEEDLLIGFRRSLFKLFSTTVPINVFREIIDTCADKCSLSCPELPTILE